MSRLQEQFLSETGIYATNSQGEPDIDYVKWLEDKVEKLTPPIERKELGMSRIMPDIFRELSFVEIAVHDAKQEPVITKRAWLVVKDFILDQLKAINTELDQKSSPDYKQALRGMMNAFLRAHGCNERVDCAKYPEYEQALLAITAQPETSKPKAKTHEEMWAHLKSLPTPSADTLLSGGMMMYYVDACYDFMCKD